jgi:hypothetical protein
MSLRVLLSTMILFMVLSSCYMFKGKNRCDSCPDFKQQKKNHKTAIKKDKRLNPVKY